MLTAGVIGLGQIGQGYDYEMELSDDSKILTHANAYTHHSNFNLIAGVDSCSNARAKFESKFKVQTYKTIEEMFSYVSPDVVSLCVPLSLHAPLFNSLLHYPLQGILVEKPISENIHQSGNLLSLAIKNNITVMANYIRRYDPAIQQLRSDIKQGTLGHLIKGMVWYSKGLANNGIHYIDLISYLFDMEFTLEPLIPKPPFSIELTEDIECDVKLIHEQANVYLLNRNQADYYLSEIDLLTSKGRLIYTNDGHKVQFFPTSQDNIFKVPMLDQNPKIYQTDFDRYQINTLNTFYKKIINQDMNYSSELIAEKIMSKFVRMPEHV